MGVRGLKHKRRGCCLRVEEICTSWAGETQDKIGMLGKEKNRLEQEARVKGVEGALEPSGDVGGGGWWGKWAGIKDCKAAERCFFCWV